MECKNPGLWNPEFSSRNSGIPLTIGIRNPIPGIQDPLSLGTLNRATRSRTYFRDLATATGASKIARGLMSKKKKKLCTCITPFVNFFAVSAQQRLEMTKCWVSWERGWQSDKINSTISVWTRARFFLFSSVLNSLLLSNCATWDYREIVWKDTMDVAVVRS